MTDEERREREERRAQRHPINPLRYIDGKVLAQIITAICLAGGPSTGVHVLGEIKHRHLEEQNDSLRTEVRAWRRASAAAHESLRVEQRKFDRRLVRLERRHPRVKFVSMDTIPGPPAPGPAPQHGRLWGFFHAITAPVRALTGGQP